MTPQELIEKTKELIAIPSTKDDPAALAQAVEGIAAMVTSRCPDITIEQFHHNDKPSFLAYAGKERPEVFDIVLNAHVDVVPGTPEQFIPVIKDERLYGRGALDMKGTAVVLADVFCELAHTVPYRLALQIVSDEEIGGYSGTRFQIDNGVRANFVIMGEYGEEPGIIYNAARGLCWMEIGFSGKSAHGGHLWNGANAVVKAGDFAGAILERYPTPAQKSWTTTASVASLSTPNTTYNKVPDEAVLKIDFRFTEEDPVFRNEASVRAFIKSIDPEAKLLNIPVFEPAVYVGERNSYVQGLSDALHSTTNTTPRYDFRPGGSDGRHYALMEIPSLEFGLYGGASHSDGEYVELRSFAEYQTTMRQFLRRPTVVSSTKQPTQSGELKYQLLRKLVAMPTVSSDFKANNQALAYISDFLTLHGMHVAEFEHEGYRSIVATTRPDEKAPAVMLSAHLDVVPAAEEQYELTIKGDKMYGRGVLDMKAAIASYLWLVDELRDDLERYDFGIMITTDEEIGGLRGVKHLVDNEGFRPQVAVIPDGGDDWQIERFAKGVQWIQLEAEGKTGHASRPWEGESAIRRLLVALHEIEQLVPAGATPEETMLSIGTIQGGTTPNQIPAHASAMIDVRTGSMEDHEQLYPRIHAIAKKHHVHTKLLVSDPPCINDMSNPYISRFSTILSQVIDRQPSTFFSYAATDGRHFSAVGIPCIITSPPSGGRHTDAEWMSKKGFEQLCTVVKQYIQTVASRATPSVVQTVEYTKAQPDPTAQSAYIWHATYGSGLYKENYLCFVTGGQPKGATVSYRGCQDTTLPVRDTFLALPHELYFGGQSQVWPDSSLVTIDPTINPEAHTIARAYLITREQFAEVLAQENLKDHIAPLPFDDAMKQGHATIGDGTGNYEELVYCGMKDGYPIYTATATTSRRAYSAPCPAYTRLLCKGLAQDTQLKSQEAIDYLLRIPGMGTTYNHHDLLDYFKK